MMTRTYAGQLCAVARALEVVGERWTLLIIRSALLGVTRFEGFRQSLGIPRNVLASRLNLLVDHGLLERVAYQQRPVRYEYLLIEQGRELATVIVALLDWGNKYCVDDLPGPPLHVLHDGCDGHVRAELVCEHCGQAVGPGETAAVRAPWRQGGDGPWPPAGPSDRVP
ncbi:helix-turn-helix domain-containing protein [Saccharopolyspora sp. NPDC000359]|uniref:winged helix-turn-helix transcriptional regulator n=1 Tax=Saccharopolyspora sp. NPDC000359 TaxID=3154251 RepID=UPI00331886F2